MSAEPAASAASSNDPAVIATGNASTKSTAAATALQKADLNVKPNASKAAIQAKLNKVKDDPAASIVIIRQAGSDFQAEVVQHASAPAAPSSSSSSAAAESTEVKPADLSQSAGRRRKRRGCTRRKGGKRKQSQRRKQSRRRR